MILVQTPQMRLTKREAQIIGLVAQGQTYEDISGVLKIGVETIKTHVFNVKIKFDARNLQQVVAMSVRHNLISI